MKWLKYISFSFLLLTAVPSLAQQDTGFVLVRSYQGDIANAALDRLDNLYIISSKGQVRKYGPTGDSLAVYNQIRNNGLLSSIDVTNPLRVLLFYKEFSGLVLVDRFLTTLTSLNLKNYGILQPGAAGMAYDNNIWVFDEYDSKLKKIDDQGNILMQTTDLRTLLNASVQPQLIISDNKTVYLADSLSGIYMFDNYGAYQRKIPLLNYQSLAIVNNNVLSTSGNLLTIYNLSNKLQTERKIPAFQPYQHSLIMPGRLVHFDADTLRIYRY